MRAVAFFLFIIIASFIFSKPSRAHIEDPLPEGYVDTCYKYFFGNVRPMGKSPVDGKYYFSFDTNALAYLIDAEQANFDDLLYLEKQAGDEARVVYATVDYCKHKLISLSFIPESGKQYILR